MVFFGALKGFWLTADFNDLRLENNDDPERRRRRHIRRSTNRVHIYPGPAFSLGFTYISGPPKAGWSFRLRINQEQIGFSFLAGHVTVSTTRAWLFCTINSTSIFLQRQISPYRPLYDSPSRHSRPLDRAEVFFLRFFCPGVALPLILFFFSFDLSSTGFAAITQAPGVQEGRSACFVQAYQIPTYHGWMEN